MSIFLYRILTAAVLLVSITINTSFAEQTYPPQKVIYHINYSEASRINATFTNISNHLAAVGEENIDLKVMIHGDTLEYFLSASEDEAKQILLDTIRLEGAQLLFCGNTLDAYNKTIDDIYGAEAEDRVQAGLPAIVALQQQGYIYVRP
ncbi:DsrE family protein [Aliamphritea spongicola]|uniref:DsrE family protein n=1 Tax=Aliamphritea spongicola TaxID=707589 RepID=UPI00196A6187|nr:DsrE family protein [Aliamphritea spongicola]MBN3564552.1 DsrE family protein [Aliamphritea spongicola]